MNKNIALDLASFSDIARIVAELAEALPGVAQEAASESGAFLLNRIKTNFLRQVNPEGVAWEPSYAAFRRSFGLGRGGGGTLFDTGTLFHSIQLFSISPYEQSIATDVFYAPFHQFGTENLPVREFLGFSTEDEEIAIQVLMTNIEESLS